MDADFAMHLLAQTLLTAARISAPVLVATLIVGVAISILQVVTQVQEMTLTFLPKLGVVLAAFLIGGAWMFSVLTEFARHMFGLVAAM
jgi:flagellar biosynthesis protein FliQ